MEIKDGGYGIVWFLGAYDFDLCEADRRVSLGICRATKQLAFFSAGTRAPLQTNLSIHGGHCTEGSRCLYSNCPCNRTTWGSYRLGSDFGRGVRSPQGYEGLKEIRRGAHLDLILLEDFGHWIDQGEDEGVGYSIDLERPLIKRSKASTADQDCRDLG
jgi:hypothetical protein